MSLKLIYLIALINFCSTLSFNEETNDSNQRTHTFVKETVASDLNKEFWEQMYQNSMLNSRSKYNTLNDDTVCFTCPVDKKIFTPLYQEALGTLSNQQAPPRVTISWAAQLNENRVIFFCSNNTRKAPNPLYLSGNDNSEEDGLPSTQLEYSCENNRLCLNNVKNSYPKNYQCFVKSYVLNVRLNVIVQLTHVLLYFSGDSVKFDYQKEVQVHENQVFTVKCEVPESNPVSIVSAYIDNKELKLTGLDKKTVENRMTINTYSFEVNATRKMNGKRVKCDAQMKDIPPDLAKTISLRSHLFKDYTISVYYLPTCVHRERVYRTGINRSMIIECPINGSNPDVTYYKMIPPSTRTKFELIDNSIETLRQVGRYRINPTSQADFGLYECIPRSLAGTAKCDIIVELGATPNPPEQCNVQFAMVNNKTFAQFSCKPGHNQGGQTSFLSIYELVDKQLKLSGRVNIDESKLDKEVPYITPADEDKYYEFLIMQENNYGNSSSVILTLGNQQDMKQSVTFNIKNFYMIGAVIAGIFLLFCLCGCCCCSDLCTSGKSDNPFCKCCSGGDHMDDEGLTYKKAPMDADALAPYSSETSKSSMKLGFNSNINSNYEYYDNTSTGLLADGLNYSQNEPYHHSSQRSRKTHRTALLPYSSRRDEDIYQRNFDENETEEHYMNDNEERQANHIEDGYSSNENPDDSLASSGAKMNDDPFTSTKTPANTNSNSMFNNNVNVTIGSGVESIKKHTYGLTTNSDIFGRTLKQNQTKFNPNNGSNHTYSSVDRKNMKLIKTDNGLVYTPIGKDSRKNSNNDEADLDANFDYDNCDELPSKFKESNKILFGNAKNSFQAELSQKLKTINKEDKNAEIYSKNIKTQNTSNPKQTLMPSASYTQSEPLSNSTATTSVSSASSASSCSSNSDLIIKRDSVYATTKRPQPPPLPPSQSFTTNSNKEYSLLKASINLNEINTISGTLKRGQVTKPTQNQNTLDKPPILKPKPRNQVYQTNQMIKKSHLNSTSESIHNQSAEPLLNQASPSTSVTDVSSTNCTPQHYNATLIEEIGYANSILNRQNTLTRSRSNSLTKNLNAKAVTTTFGAKTTTAVANPNLVYSSVKINAEFLNNSNIQPNVTMKTFSPNSHYDSSTIGRKQSTGLVKKNLTSIDDQISAMNSMGGGANARTLERRHVKNSEC